MLDVMRSSSVRQDCAQFQLAVGGSWGLRMDFACVWQSAQRYLQSLHGDQVQE